MTDITWLLLTYRLPAKPVALRATVRRKLTAGGAVYVANAVAALPASSAGERLLRGLRKTITEHGGSAVRDSPADAAPGPGDQCGPASKVSCHCYLLSVKGPTGGSGGWPLCLTAAIH